MGTSEVGRRSRKKQRLSLEARTWCERGDLNPHGFTRQILSLVRLPIPPLSHSLRQLRTIVNASTGADPPLQNPGSAYGLSRPGNSLPLNGPSFPILVQFFPVKFFPLICLWRLYETLPTTPVSLLSLHYPNRAVDCRKCARFCPKHLPVEFPERGNTACDLCPVRQHPLPPRQCERALRPRADAPSPQLHQTKRYAARERSHRSDLAHRHRHPH